MTTSRAYENALARQAIFVENTRLAKENDRLREDLIDIRNYTEQPWTMPERLQAIRDTVTRALAGGGRR